MPLDPRLFEGPREIEITNEGHKFRVGEYLGAAHVLDVLEKIPEAKRTPGFNYAIALVERECAEARAKIMASNLRAVAAAGWDINQVGNISLAGFKLIVEAAPQSEEA
jgi:hypothetical protein